MKIISSKEENRTAYLTVELEPAELEEYLDYIYKRMVQQAEVPGFRKGNAPRDVLEKNVGRPKMLEEVRKEFMPVICARVISGQKLQIMGQPMVKFISEEPLKFEMVVPLKPLIELTDYHAIRLGPEPMEVTDKDVGDVLDGLRRQSASYESVDRPVERGDMLTIDIEGTVMESPFIKSKSVQFAVQPDFPPDIPGLAEHFVGMKKGEEQEFKHRLPEAFPNKVLAGKEVTFKAKVLEIKKEDLQALDDAFASSVSPDLKTLDELRERIRQNMKADYEQKSRTKFEEKLIETVIGQSKLEIPPLLIDSEADYLFKEGLQQLQESCPTKEEFENRLKQIPVDKVREQYRAMAEKRVRWNLVAEEIEAKEKIEVTEEETDAEIESMLQGVFGKEQEDQRKQLNEPYNRENVRAMVAAHKVVDLLTRIAATPVEVAVTGKEAAPGKEAPAEVAASPAKKTRKKKEKEE